MIPQCDFCFCDLTARHVNFTVCPSCLQSPLTPDAIYTIPRFQQCTACDKMLCSFHLEEKYLAVDLCKKCYRTSTTRGSTAYDTLHGYGSLSSSDDEEGSSDGDYRRPRAVFSAPVASRDDDRSDDEDCYSYSSMYDGDGDRIIDDDGDGDGDGNRIIDDDGDDDGNRIIDDDGDGDGDRIRDDDGHDAIVNREQTAVRDRDWYGEDVAMTDAESCTFGVSATRWDLARFYTVVDHEVRGQEANACPSPPCPICLEPLRPTGPNERDGVSSVNVALNCHASHIFHLGCVATWLHKRAVCPLCCCKLDG